MDLYSGCSTLLQTSDRAGNGVRGDHPEPARRDVRREADRQRDRLHAAVRRPRSASCRRPSTILVDRTRIEGGTLRLVGELYNNTSKTVGSIKVTAKLYNASNVLLATRTAYADLRTCRRQPGAVPDRRVRCRPGTTTRPTRSARPRPRGSIGAPTPTTTTNGPDGGDHWTRRRDGQEPLHDDGHDALGRGHAVRRPRQHPGCRPGERRARRPSGAGKSHDLQCHLHPDRPHPGQGLRPGDALPLSLRHLHQEGGAVRAGPLHADPAAAGRQQLARDRQAQAQARRAARDRIRGPRRVGPVEALEDVRQVRLRRCPDPGP